MRMKMVCDDRTLREVANEFLALKKAQKVRERTLSDYKKYIDKFLDQSQNTLDVDVLKIEILEYFADIPKTSPASGYHTVCATSIILEKESSSVIHKNRAGASAPTRSNNYSILALPQLLT